MIGSARIAYRVPPRVVDHSRVPAPIENSRTRTWNSLARAKWPASCGAIKIRNIPATPTTYRSQLTWPSAYRTNPIDLPDISPRPAVGFENLVQGAAAAGEGAERTLHGPHDSAERELVGQEGVDRLLVGGVQDGGMAAAGLGRLAGQPDAREPALVEVVELEAAELFQARRRYRVRQAVGVGEGDRDGQPHVRPAELRLERPVDELDERVDHALWMDADGDGLQGQPEQVVSLDQLEPFVHQSGRVDSDLRPHRPARMVEGLLDGHLVEVDVGLRPERTAACGDDQAAHVVALFAPQTLPYGAVFGVDGPDPLLAGDFHDQLARHHEHLFGRQGDLLPRMQSRHGGRERPRPRDGHDHDVAPRVGDHGLDLRVEVRLAGAALDEVLGLAVGRAHALGEAEQLEALWVAVDHVQRLPADRTGGAEQRDVDWSRHVRRWKTVT